MEEPTSEQLLNYIDAAVNLYERVHGRSRIGGVLRRVLLAAK
jgi:hypothetical protein